MGVGSRRSSDRARIGRLPSFLAGLAAVAAVWSYTRPAQASHDPNRTATIYVDGFHPEGATRTGVFGAENADPLLDRIAPEDCAALERAAEAIVAALPEDALSALTTCRFCDERRCAGCPMEIFGLLAPAGNP